MQNIRALVDNDICKVDECIYNSFSSDNQILNEIKNFVSGESKRIRSILCLLYLKAFNAVINDDVIIVSAVAEMIHNASLLHDDVIDNGDIRRGQPTLFKKFGSKMSVITGDYILSAAVEMLLKTNNRLIYDLFINTTKKMSNAEIIQFINRNKDIRINDYINIIEGKTASLFSVLLKSSALLSGLDADLAEKMGNIFGIIFQINNDENPQSATNDKLNGVKTAVDILGIEKTQALKDNYKEEMKKLISEIPDNKYRKGIEDLVNKL